MELGKFKELVYVFITLNIHENRCSKIKYYLTNKKSYNPFHILNVSTCYLYIVSSTSYQVQVPFRKTVYHAY